MQQALSLIILPLILVTGIVANTGQLSREKCCRYSLMKTPGFKPCYKGYREHDHAVMFTRTHLMQKIYESQEKRVQMPGNKRVIKEYASIFSFQ